jgi:hypothetical protein
MAYLATTIICFTLCFSRQGLPTSTYHSAASSLRAGMLPNTPDAPSQPPVERSSPLESVWPPIRDGDRKERSLFIYPRTNKEIHSLEMLEKLRRYDLGRIPEIEIPEMKKTLRNQQSTYCDYLNRLSAAFRDRNSVDTVYIFLRSLLYSQSHTASSSDKWNQKDPKTTQLTPSVAPTLWP